MKSIKQAPQAMPILPLPDSLRELSDPKAVFDFWESECERITQENDKLFTHDLKLMKRCTFINGMLGLSLSNHFKWCPHDNWDAYWMDQGFPKMLTLE